MTTVQSKIAPGERLRARPAWKALAAHYRSVRKFHLRELFAADPKRGERLTLEAAGLYLDFSKNRVTDETLALLVRLAEEWPTRADRRHVPRRPHQRHRAPRGPPRGAARAARGVHPDRRRERGAGGTCRARSDGRSSPRASGAGPGPVTLVPVTNPIHLSHQNFPHRVHCWSGRVSAQTPMPDAGVPR
jgi:hypothetical protein